MKYMGLDNLSKEKVDRNYYCHFTVSSDTGETLLDFYTNRELNGMFYKNKNGEYKQILGTYDFSLNKSRGTVYKILKEMALKE